MNEVAMISSSNYSIYDQEKEYIEGGGGGGGIILPTRKRELNTQK